MVKSKSKIEKQIGKKTNSELVETIILAKKNDKWLDVASAISSPRSQRININLQRIDKETKEGDTVVVPGKILGVGDITKKIRIVALSFSSEAEKKLKEKKCEVILLKDEIKLNPDKKGVRVLR